MNCGTFRVKVIFLTLTLFSLSAYPQKKYKATQQAMDDIYSAFVDVLPLASRPGDFKDKKNEQYIEDRLRRLMTSFKKATHLKKLNKPGFRPSYETISEHLDATLENFSEGNKEFARMRFKATVELCMSCHTQLPEAKQRQTFYGFEKLSRKDFSSDFEYADFLFVKRNYPRAMVYYKKEIEKRLEESSKTSKIPGGGAMAIDLRVEESLSRILSINTKVIYRPKRGYQLLLPYKKNKELPRFLKGKIDTWLEDLEKWDKKKFDGKVSTQKELKSFIEKHLSDEEDTFEERTDVDLLVISGVLYRYINEHPQSQEDIPQVLYWLGKIDEKLKHSYFYSLGELYLKTCIKKYTSSPYAKKCYEQYKDNIEFGFTGTSGTQIPDEEKEELKNLKKILDSKQQKKAK